MTEIEKAKETLKNAGYYVDNLWHIQDVQHRYICTNEEAQEILRKVLNNDYIVSEINDTITNTIDDDAIL